MNISTTVMTVTPFPDSLALSLIGFIIVGTLVIAGCIAIDALRQRREAHLEAMNSNPELEVFGIPTHSVKAGHFSKKEGWEGF